METWMELRRKWMKFIKKYMIAVLIFVALIVVFIFVAAFFSQGVEVKQDLFSHEVNTELDQNAGTYLRNVREEDAQVNFKEVDIHELGNYHGSIFYEDETYDIPIKVVDTTAPSVSITKDEFVFSLDTTLEEVNQTIFAALTITDNYEAEFAQMEIISELPTEEKEMLVLFSVKDMSDNQSNEVKITILFTKDGQYKEALAKEEITRELNSTAKSHVGEENSHNTHGPEVEEPKTEGSNTPEEPKQEALPENTPSTEGNTTSNNPPANDGNSNQNIGGGPSNNGTTGNEESVTPPKQDPPSITEPPQKPEPTPQPEPKPEPETPSYTVPEGAVDMGLFNSKQEGWDYCVKIVDDPNSPYYLWEIRGDGYANGQWSYYLFQY